MRKGTMCKLFILSIVHLFVFSFSSIGCMGYLIPGSKNIHFETIDISKGGDFRNSGKDTQILILTSNEDVIKKDIFYDDETEKQILKTDFTNHFLITAFQGYLGYWGSMIKVLSARQKENTIYIIAHFGELEPNERVLPMDSSPYHIISVEKEDMVQLGEINFILTDEAGKQRATTNCRIN